MIREVLRRLSTWGERHRRLLARLMIALMLTVIAAAARRGGLGEHHADALGDGLVLAEKRTDKPPSLTYHQALEEALCHGWIDGQAGGRDESSYRQRSAALRRRSAWSKRNTGIA